MKALDLKNVKFIKNDKTIDIEEKLKRPVNLYKFYSINNNSVNNIENGTIFFTPNNLLNDILEGNFELLWDFDNLMKNETVLLKFRQDIFNKINKYKKDFLRWRGVFSMSEDYKNELLWIHYANESGFCIELDTNRLNEYFITNKQEHNYFFPMSYHNPVGLIDFNEHSIFEQKNGKQYLDAILPIMYCFAVKEEHWAYEKEWRLLINHEKFNYVSDVNYILNDIDKNDENKKILGNNIEIEREIITKIILAPRFFNNNRFNKHQLLERDIEILNFKNNEEGQNSYRLLNNLHKHYSSCIYQINKVANRNFIEREITLKIEIIDISENYIKLKRKPLK